MPESADVRRYVVRRLKTGLERCVGCESEDPDSEEARCIFELMEAVDAYIPEPVRDVDKPFLMPIEDVFSISGRGTVVTGRVERGVINVGEEVEIVGIRPTHKTVCTGVVKRDDVERGQVVAKVGSITPHTKFKAESYVLKKEEGGERQRGRCRSARSGTRPGRSA